MSAPHRPDLDPVGTVADALRYLPPDCDRETWVTLGMAVKSALGDAGFDVWDQWSQGADSYRAKDARDAWKSFKDHGKVTAGTLFHLAGRAGWPGRRGQGGAALPPPPPRDPKAIEAQARAERERHEAAARKARSLFARAALAESHPYLTRKGIKPHGARLASFGKLLIPVYQAPRNLVNLQMIGADGGKLFLKDGRKAGCYWWIGPESTAVVCIAEGYADAASVHEATGHRCYIGFDAGNLPAVAVAVRGLHPDAAIVVCADNDATGLKFAHEAAHRIGGTVAVPDPPYKDFNDMAAALALSGGCDGRP